MKIKFNSIHIENFMSLGQADVSLDDRGYVLVSGINNNPADLAKSNGSGKSSIFDAIMWCMTGSTIRGNKDVVNIHGSDGAIVDMAFTVDNVNYRLIRSKNHSKWKTNLRIYVNEEDRSGKGIRDSEKLLLEYIPDLTASLIGSVIILGQGLPDRFSNNTPSGRKDVLEKLCKSDFMIQELKDRIANRKTTLQDEIREVEDSVLVLDTKVSVATASIDKGKKSVEELESSNNFDEQLNKLQESLNLHTTYVEEYESQFSIAEQEYQRIADEISSLTALKGQKLEEINARYTDIIDPIRLKRLEAQAQLTTAKNNLLQLESITDTCPTCGQKLPDVHKPDTTLAIKQVEECQSIFDTLTKELDKQQAAQFQEKEQLKEYYQSTLDRKYLEMEQAKSTVRPLQENIRSISRTIEGIRGQIITVTAQRDNYAETLQRLQDEIIEQQDVIAECQDTLLYKYKIRDDLQVRLGIINKFNSVVSREFRGYLLRSIIEFIDKKAKEYCRDIFETDLIEFMLDGNNISISYDGKEYESLSGGEKQKVDLIIQFSIRDMLCSYIGFSTNIIALDEIFDNLDDVGCGKVIDLISTKLHDISSIFIITHHGAELNIPADDQITVVKNSEGVSYLQ